MTIFLPKLNVANRPFLRAVPRRINMKQNWLSLLFATFFTIFRFFPVTIPQPQRIFMAISEAVWQVDGFLQDSVLISG